MVGRPRKTSGGLSSVVVVEAAMGLALILLPLFVFSHQSSNDDPMRMFFQPNDALSPLMHDGKANFTWRGQFDLPATEFTEHCSNR